MRQWKHYQARHATEAAIRRWFPDGKPRAVAVVLGKVSGNLVCRDFDTMEGYRRWAKAHPDLAAALPTVATARGRHVYFCADDLGFADLGDGEYRGNGHYCLLPPSPHPDGTAYKWIVPLPSGDVPFVRDVRAVGFLGENQPCNRENGENGENGDNRENRGSPKSTEAVGEVGSFSSQSGVPEDVARALRDSLPTGPGRRNRQVFELARALKAVPRLADAPVDRLEPFVRQWHHTGVAKGVISTQPCEETWIDFLRAWPKVKFPKGAEPMGVIFEKAKRKPLPRAADKYEQPQLRILVALCRELQAASGKEPFFLSCRSAGRLLGVPHVTAWRWLFLLTHNGDLQEVEKGDQSKRRASRYRYVRD